MKLADVLEGGVTGATTLSMLQEALHKMDGRSPRPFLHKSRVIKKFGKLPSKKKKDSSKILIEFAGELLANFAVFGLTGLGKKKNAVKRGMLLGAIAGLGSVLIETEREKESYKQNGHSTDNKQSELTRKAITLALYTGGGLLAGLAVKKLNSKKFKKQLKKL